jgi:hypothetical protein
MWPMPPPPPPTTEASVTSPPIYLGSGDGQQHEQQQHNFHPHPQILPARSMPHSLPLYWITCSVLVWQGALQQSWCIGQWGERQIQVYTAVGLRQQRKQLALSLNEEGRDQTTRGEGWGVRPGEREKQWGQIWQQQQQQLLQHLVRLSV